MSNPDPDDTLIHLLPFYVNGTLDSDHCAQIDARLAQSPRMQEELALLNAIARTVKTGGKAMVEGVDNSVTRLRAIHTHNEPRPVDDDEDEAEDQPDKINDPRLNGFLGYLNPRNWHPAVSLALAIAALAQAGLMAGMSGDKQANEQQIAKLEKRVGDLEYQLASGPGGGAAKPDILVQIKPDISWNKLSDLLISEGLTIIDGPSDNTLSLSSELEGAALDGVIARLLASGLIETADKAA